MSGNAFKQTERMSTETFENLKHLLTTLSTGNDFNISNPHFPEHFQSKEDHGDLDVFLADTVQNRCAVNELAMIAYRNEQPSQPWVDMGVFAKHNSTVEPSERFLIQTEGSSQLRLKSTEGKWCHVDVQFVPSNCLSFSAHYYSYGDLSQLLQIWLRNFKIVLKNTGLYYKTVTAGVEHLVLITTDWFAVLDILELNHSPYRGYAFDDFRDAFIWMERSHLFKPDMLDLREGDKRASRPMFAALKEHNFNEYTYKRFTTIDISYKVLERLPEAFQAIMMAKVNDLSHCSVDQQFYALNNIINIAATKRSNFDGNTNLSVFDDGGYTKLVKDNKLPF